VKETMVDNARQKKLENIYQFQLFEPESAAFSDCEPAVEANNLSVDRAGSVEKHGKRKKGSTKGRNVDRELKTSSNNSFTESDSAVSSSNREYRGVVVDGAEMNDVPKTPSTGCSTGAVKIDTINHFFSLHPKSVKNPQGHLTPRFTQSPSMTQLDCPKDRYQFYMTFSMLVNAGNVAKKEKEIRTSGQYARQISEQEVPYVDKYCDIYRP